MSEPLTVPPSLTAQVERLLPSARLGRLGRLRRGLEKEGLRVDAHGHIAQTPHPHALGSKLTHPHITTDYAEALLEYITPVYSEPKEALAFLSDLHTFTYHHLDSEWIWPGSMPARLSGNDSVLIADYGRSNVGTMKHVYRKGLDVRYGRIMQAIAGVHYNVSLPEDMWHALREMEKATNIPFNDYRSTRYFGMIRHFRRYSWLLLYLFGASPAIDKSFLPNGHVPDKLQLLSDDTYYAPYATTLRMSDLGYQNKVQAQLKICFNSLSNYVNTLRHAISTPWPDYEALGVRNGDEWRQLNANILQIENEYYSDIRPKRVAKHNETPSQALEARGVEYIEVRCLDLNPFDPLGVTETQMRFVDTFLMWCLLSDSPWISDEECDRLDDNRRLVVERGRDPELRLTRDGESVTLPEWGEQIFAEMADVARLLDAVEEGEPHAAALDELAPRLQDPSLTPSGQMLARLQESNGSLSDTLLEMAQAQADKLKATPMLRSREALLAQLIDTSHQQQRDIEEADQESFSAFLESYFAKARESRALSALPSEDAQ
ncbi:MULTISPECIES: glutamate--cysteine ligase [unclassified Halomonas]|uniref:glutamate--cysteine ligase n=1 Tax=unclassified Halomonas TaxID=2609666 RepID=UPI001EF68CCF|nr:MULTISPECIES: glutamate--cysteine ligase [unclassified Halomonas]MCG7591955.1 glutamate--cysteine ligase [Halomonas sp. McD50-5]MCG7617958.1 glutamate--cysteine ligase [Halomonas sp. McD50-4]